MERNEFIYFAYNTRVELDKSRALALLSFRRIFGKPHSRRSQYSSNNAPTHIHTHTQNVTIILSKYLPSDMRYVEQNTHIQTLSLYALRLVSLLFPSPPVK